MIAIDLGMRITNNQWNFSVMPLNNAVINNVVSAVGSVGSGSAGIGNAYANAYVNAYVTYGGDADEAAKAATAAALKFISDDAEASGPIAQHFNSIARAAAAAYAAAAPPAPTERVKAAVKAAGLGPEAAEKYAEKYANANYSIRNMPGQGAEVRAAEAYSDDPTWENVRDALHNVDTTLTPLNPLTRLPLGAATTYAKVFVKVMSVTGDAGIAAEYAANALAASGGQDAVLPVVGGAAADAVIDARDSPVFDAVERALRVAPPGGPGLNSDQASTYAFAYVISGGDADKAAQAVSSLDDPVQVRAAAAAAAANANVDNALPTAAMIGTSKSATNGSGQFGERMPNATTNFGTNSFEHSGKRQDGYTFGDLRFVNVDNNGVLSATYSNGVTLQLFQIALNDFPSLQNLRREGGEPLQRNPRIGPTEHRSARIGGLRHNPRLFPGAK